MFARVLTGGLVGVDSYRIEVEVDCCGGIGQMQIVGLPGASVKESQDRVRSAIKACGHLLPPAKKWVINMAPADTRKDGPSYDLPIAVGVLASCGFVPVNNLSKLWMIGELGLNGAVRSVSGVLPLAMSCLRSGASGIIVPDENAEEAALVKGLTVYPVSHLRQAILIVEDLKNGAAFDGGYQHDFQSEVSNVVPFPDFSDVKGQSSARRALEIAAAGRHNVLMVGPPGAGKSMLAERLPGIMPPLSFEESLDLTKLYSVAGLLNNGPALIKQRPFRSPHHSSSVAGLIGGGKNPRPGEISLSHQGILFLDELTEFTRSHLDNLRQPLETRKVTISRATQALTYPASFLLVGACNPCPCGHRGDPARYCVCTPAQADRYWARLSGPLLDRIDIHVEVHRLNEEELAKRDPAESSESMRLRVLRAVQRQLTRNIARDSTFSYNGQLSHDMINKVCLIDEQTRRFLARSISGLGLSARAYDRVLRMGRTIADLDDAEAVTITHLAEAIRYRVLGRAAA